MSDARDSTIKLLGKTIQSTDDQQRKYMKGVQVFLSDFELNPVLRFCFEQNP
ncbi:hypothetical protein HanRHA438_Chr17g0841701 [Helianthus annuus]|nr:hypothetical protein HanRHA438_Chr17g0841701 [Helianthus annuus]